MFLPTYEKVFNTIFDSGVMPDVWPVGNIKPIYKNKVNPLDPKNLPRLLFLAALVNYAQLLNKRLCRFSEEALLMNENQFGFRKSYSTTDSIFTLFSFFEILKRKKEKKCFVPLSTSRRLLTRYGGMHCSTNYYEIT